MFAMLTTVMGGAFGTGAAATSVASRRGSVSPGYWALAAYRAALLGPPGSLVRPIAMLGVFGLAGGHYCCLNWRDSKVIVG